MSIEEYGLIVTVTGGIVGGAFGLYQYYKSQQGKKTEFAANLLPVGQVRITALDTGGKPVSWKEIPEKVFPLAWRSILR